MKILATYWPTWWNMNGGWMTRTSPDIIATRVRTCNHLQFCIHVLIYFLMFIILHRSCRRFPWGRFSQRWRWISAWQTRSSSGRREASAAGRSRPPGSGRRRWCTCTTIYNFTGVVHKVVGWGYCVFEEKITQRSPASMSIIVSLSLSSLCKRTSTHLNTWRNLSFRLRLGGKGGWSFNILHGIVRVSITKLR